MTRTVGILLLVVGIGICVVGGAFLAVSATSSNSNLSASGAVLGGVILFVIAAPVAGAGVFGIVRGRREESEQEEADELRKLLDIIEARGEVSVSDVIIELHSDFQSVKDMVYKLVGMGVFSGYANWDEGKLYSANAADLHAISECRNCGGAVSFVGKGVQKCPHCGTDYFLAQ